MEDLIFVIFAFALTAAVLWWLFTLVKKVFWPKGDVVFCTACGHEGNSRKTTRGSTAIELLLWILFLVPGLIYSFWRLGGKGQKCGACGSEAVIPPGSPMAVMAKKQMTSH